MWQNTCYSENYKKQYMEYLLKGSIGAGVVILIAALSNTRFFFLSGLLPLFPTFALMAHILSYQEQGAAAVKSVIGFGLLSIIPYVTYLLSVMFLIDRFGLYKSLFTGLVLWLLAAAMTYSLWERFELQAFFIKGINF